MSQLLRMVYMPVLHPANIRHHIWDIFPLFWLQSGPQLALSYMWVHPQLCTLFGLLTVCRRLNHIFSPYGLGSFVCTLQFAGSSVHLYSTISCTTIL